MAKPTVDMSTVPSRKPKETSRYETVANMVSLLTGATTLEEGGETLPNLLNYSRTPLTTDTHNQIIRYVTQIHKLNMHLKYQVNLAVWMRKKRLKVK